MPIDSSPGRLIDHGNQLEFFFTNADKICDDIIGYPVVGMNNTFIQVTVTKSRIRRDLAPGLRQFPVKIAISKIANYNTCLQSTHNSFLETELCSNATLTPFIYHGNMSLMANHLCLNALTYDLAHLQPCDDQATLWSFPGRTIELIPSFNRNVRMCMALSDSKLTFTECHSTAAQRWTLLTNVSSAFLDHVTSTLKLPALPLFHLSPHHAATPIQDQSRFRVPLPQSARLPNLNCHRLSPPPLTPPHLSTSSWTLTSPIWRSRNGPAM